VADRGVFRFPGMPALAAVSLTGFSGYAALLAVAPAWAVEGGATEAGAGLVNGVLLAATVLTQMVVPRLVRSFGTGPAIVAGLVLMGLAAPAYALSSALGPVLAWSAVRGAGFGILTVTGSTIVAHLVPEARRGEAVGVYGLAVAVPNLLLMPGSVVVADRFGFGWAFAIAALPLVGVPFALALGRRVRAVEEAALEEELPPADRRTVLAVLRPTLVLFAVTMAGGALMTFAPQLGVSGSVAALVLLVLGVGTALARWLIGRVADRHGAERFLAPMLLVCAVGLGLCALAVTRGNAVLLVLGAMVIGPAYGALQNLTLVVAFSGVPAARLPVASAVWNAGFDAGTASGSVLVGAVAAAASFGSAFTVLAVLVLAALVVAPRRAAA
jgi:MFS family permease